MFVCVCFETWSVDADLKTALCRVPQDGDNVSTLPDFLRVQALLEMKNQITTFTEILLRLR